VDEKVRIGAKKVDHGLSELLAVQLKTWKQILDGLVQIENIRLPGPDQHRYIAVHPHHYPMNLEGIETTRKCRNENMAEISLICIGGGNFHSPEIFGGPAAKVARFTIRQRI